MGKIPNLAAIRDWCLSKFQPIGSYAAPSDIPTKTSQLNNNSGFITKSVDDLENYYKKEETYNRSAADEKFAEKTEIPENVSDLTNDSNYLTNSGDASGTTVTFEQATERANVQPGDDLSTAFAKLSKYCADLKNVAFTGAYGDLTGTPQSLKNPNALTFSGAVTGSYDGSAAKSVAIPSGTNNLLATNAGTWLDAVQGKTLDDKITQINSDLQFLNFSGDTILNFYLNHKNSKGCFILNTKMPEDLPDGFTGEGYIEFLRDESSRRCIVKITQYNSFEPLLSLRSIFREEWSGKWIKLN